MMTTMSEWTGSLMMVALLGGALLMGLATL